ncbi:Formylglycine-generating sulfatase enzyme [Anaerohalosphaera lusitana]|uniref:Formylglycine-generating sulfatase enzyme n=1 Tax=Anaerohalosphaera lusitana TaxID=1936003 RepID=A0A1U9NRF0_9BACT|nr:SUMF1/EgtB/PvdO family nonheme iron enzyme [Anaerohalosphaera lusitana]AQT70347.1 Formylglycine-generating sulfatase enzyme [Anaerohalosphaera lusitana]
MKPTLTAVLCIFALTCPASAELIQGIDMELVTIGDAGNPGDTRAAANPVGAGSVDYTYRIGKYEVTNGQWDTFIGLAGKPVGSPIGPYDGDAFWVGENIPANGISWLEAAQFCNYLTSGDKSSGAYLFTGDNTNPGQFLGIDRDTAITEFGTAYVIPTEDEWYKAAYWTGDGYSTYANGTDTLPVEDVDSNYLWDSRETQPWDVGSGKMEQNGTFDMMGNIYEWTETGLDEKRILRGGAAGTHHTDAIGSTYQFELFRTGEYGGVGFRIAAVPEPTTLALLGLGGLLLRNRRK